MLRIRSKGEKTKAEHGRGVCPKCGGTGSTIGGLMKCHMSGKVFCSGSGKPAKPAGSGK